MYVMHTFTRMLVIPFQLKLSQGILINITNSLDNLIRIIPFEMREFNYLRTHLITNTLDETKIAYRRRKLGRCNSRDLVNIDSK